MEREVVSEFDRCCLFGQSHSFYLLVVAERDYSSAFEAKRDGKKQWASNIQRAEWKQEGEIVLNTHIDWQRVKFGASRLSQCLPDPQRAAPVPNHTRRRELSRSICTSSRCWSRFIQRLECRNGPWTWWMASSTILSIASLSRLATSWNITRNRRWMREPFSVPASWYCQASCPSTPRLRPAKRWTNICSKSCDLTTVRNMDDHRLTAFYFCFIFVIGFNLYFKPGVSQHHHTNEFQQSITITHCLRATTSLKLDIELNNTFPKVKSLTLSL